MARRPVQLITNIHGDARRIFNVVVGTLSFTYDRPNNRIFFGGGSSAQIIFEPGKAVTLFAVNNGSAAIGFLSSQADQSSDHDVLVGNQGADTFHKSDTDSEIRDFGAFDKFI
jgi:hypothetical protein